MKMDWMAIWMPNSVIPAKKTGATSPTSPTSRASLVKTLATAAGNRMTSSAQVPSKANDAPISQVAGAFHAVEQLRPVAVADDGLHALREPLDGHEQQLHHALQDG